MSSLDLYGPPPTKSQLAEARNLLETQESSCKSLSEQISSKKKALERLIAESQAEIDNLQSQKDKVAKDLAVTLAYISPLRQLPNDILREVFYHVFEAKPCCAWDLAAVCVSWRRIVLGMPNLWSKIRWSSTLNSSPDTIRLWLSRSGTKLPLDIEIRLSVPPTTTKRVAHVPPPGWTPAPGSPFINVPPLSPVHDVYPPPGVDVITMDDDPFDNFAPFPPPWHPPPGVVGIHVARPSRDKNKNQTGKTMAAQWAHVAMFYLAEQMSRWRRFVFRFDRHFPSISALRAIAGEAPLLEEFEVTCADSGAGVYNVNGDWPQIPLINQAQASGDVHYPKLRSITLQLIPFKWSSTALTGGLRSLTLRSLSTLNINVDRLMYIIDCNHELEFLSLTFQVTQQAVLPLNGTTLPHLKTMLLSGSYLLSTLLEALTTPALETLGLGFEPREPIEEAIASLLTRSGGPPLSRLTLSYTGASPFYAGLGTPGAWAFLAGAPAIRVFSVGQSSFENIVSALARPTSAPMAMSDDEDDDGPVPVPPGVAVGAGNGDGDVGVIAADIEPGTWLVPSLERLSLRSCHTGSDSAIQKLIKLVEARNPLQTGNGNGNNVIEPHLTRLKTLEVHDCVQLGEDVLKWLRARVPEVKYTEPLYNRRIPRSPSYFM